MRARDGDVSPSKSPKPPSSHSRPRRSGYPSNLDVCDRYAWVRSDHRHAILRTAGSWNELPRLAPRLAPRQGNLLLGAILPLGAILLLGARFWILGRNDARSHFQHHVPAVVIVLTLQVRAASRAQVQPTDRKRLLGWLGAAHLASLLVLVVAVPGLLILLAYAASRWNMGGEGGWPIAPLTSVGPEGERRVGRLAVFAAAAWGTLSAWALWRWQNYCTARLAQPEVARGLMRPIPIVLALCGILTFGIWHGLFLG